MPGSGAVTDVTLEDATFEAWIRSGELPCVAAAIDLKGCMWRIHFAHLRHSGMGGKVVPSVGNGVPMCVAHHAIYHSIWRTQFETIYEVNLDEIAQWYALRFDAPFGAAETVPPSGAQ